MVLCRRSRQLLVVLIACWLSYGCGEISKEKETAKASAGYIKREVQAIRKLRENGVRVTRWLPKQDGPIHQLRLVKTTDDSLSHLKAFTNLQELYLSATLITNLGLISLSELPELHTLYIQKTPTSDQEPKGITDAGIVHLTKVPKLTSLTLYGTTVTDNGISELKKQLPKLRLIKLEPNPAADRWVEKKVRAGEVADLQQRFPDQADRVLSASFLIKLLTIPPRDSGIRRPRLVIKNAVVIEPIDLQLAEIPYQTSLVACDFKEEVDVRSSHFQKSLGLMSSSFTQVKFSSIKVEGVLDATDAKFTSVDDTTTFHGMDARQANFQNALFNGRVDFANVTIGRGFILDAARFTNPDQEVSFNGIDVGGSFAVRSAQFAGRVNFVGANIRRQFRAEGADFTNDHKKVLFSRMNVGDGAFFRPVREEDFFLRGVKKIVGDKVVFRGPVSFSNARFGSIDFSDVSWPNSIGLAGMSYGSIDVEHEPGSQEWLDTLKVLAGRSKFDTSVYLTLEAFLQQEGYEEHADAVYAAMKTRQRESLSWFSAARWKSLFLEILVCHGRCPSWAFVWSIPFVLLGCLVFRHSEMEAIDPKDRGLDYYAIWYSLDLYVPFINLRTADAWRPKARRSQNYMRFHTIVGWILIPIGLAALTGIIR